MKLVTWSEWLHQHIPYYEQQRQLDHFGDSPPACVLVVTPVDRNRRVGIKGLTNWEVMANQISNLGYESEPIFLDNDSHQCWYWAFWDQGEGLAVVLGM